MPTRGSFEALARRLSKSGVEASAPAHFVGRSGAKHEFAFAVGNQNGRPTVVVDAALSMKVVEELKVLSFYAKVFDLSPEHALLCVSPRLGEKGKKMANEYRISVLENDVPKMLVPMVEDYIEGMLGKKPRKR